MMTGGAGGEPATAAPARAGMMPWVVCLFFTWGLGTVLVDTLVPKLKALFSLSYTEVMLTQFCFFLAYLLMSVPAGLLLARLGYVRGILVGLAVMALGCLLFTPAAAAGVYPGFLLALFVMASGITLLQVAAKRMRRRPTPMGWCRRPILPPPSTVASSTACRP